MSPDSTVVSGKSRTRVTPDKARCADPDIVDRAARSARQTGAGTGWRINRATMPAPIIRPGPVIARPA
jgi:hypothetical protein